MRASFGWLVPSDIASVTTSFGFSNGSRFHQNPLAMENPALLTPMPNASVRTAAAVNHGLFAIRRMPYFTSWIKPLTAAHIGMHSAIWALFYFNELDVG